MIKPAATVLATLALAATPIAAQPSVERTPAKMQEAEGIGRFATPILLFAAGAAVVLTIILLDSDDDSAVSP